MYMYVSVLLNIKHCGQCVVYYSCFHVCVCLCLSAHMYQAQTDKVDVNVPNGDGATSVMLAVRDIDLFEGMATLLPWEHRPVEVVKELLRLSA